jgi:hydrogenase maturation factor HypF (carbamoyltransferase family)
MIVLGKDVLVDRVRIRVARPVDPRDLRQFRRGRWGYRLTQQTCQRCARRVSPQCIVRLLDIDERTEHLRMLVLCERCRNEYLDLQ